MIVFSGSGDDHTKGTSRRGRDSKCKTPHLPLSRYSFYIALGFRMMMFGFLFLLQIISNKQYIL